MALKACCIKTAAVRCGWHTPKFWQRMFVFVNTLSLFPHKWMRKIVVISQQNKRLLPLSCVALHIDRTTTVLRSHLPTVHEGPDSAL